MPNRQIVKKNGWQRIINILFVIALLFIATLLVMPSFKSTVLQGLMKIGLFKPKNESVMKADRPTHAPLSHISFRDQDNRIVNLGDLKGKVIFINFWATWCPPCIAEMPSLQNLYNMKKQDEELVFLFVETDGNLKKAIKFMNKNQYDLPTYTPNSPIPADLLGSTIPTTVILNKSGEIAFKHEGMADYSHPDATRLLDKLKAQ
ncbi:redoxin family protein [Olivibacter sp. CPCC 100613]|uniref:TlpA family protein disulfide reductase n=1 Tax=Olivibacter sp. CPCC 100613 TaxID=3079931 RepID=UPI002FF7E3C2